MSIDDSVFTYLMELRKEFAENVELVVGPPPIKWSRDLVSLDSKDTFILDYYRGEINIRACFKSLGIFFRNAFEHQSGHRQENKASYRLFQPLIITCKSSTA